MKKLQMLLIFLCMTIGMITAQVTKVTGIVIDADTNEPIIGASVLVKGTTIGSITDVNGRYEVTNIPKGGKTLTISFVGMRTMEVAITSSKPQTIMMRPDAQLIDEVVVVAYGTAKRESITGAIASVGTKELEKRPITNALGALEGTTTGIQINNTNGEPGSTPDIRIRGFNTVNGTNAPLYIVDGIPMGGSTNDISANDIESISILKDAASAAMYGSRAANGVVLITTKKGKSEKMRIKLATNQGFYSRMFPEYEKLSADEWMEAMWKTGYNSILSTPANAGKYTEEQAAAMATTELWDKIIYNIYNVPKEQVFDANGKLSPNAKVKPLVAEDLDWFKPMERTGHRQEYSVSGDAASAKHSLYFSVNYLNEEGYAKTSEFERYTGRLNGSFRPKKWLNLGFNLSGNHRVSNNTSSPYYYSRAMAPIYPVHAHDYTTTNGDYIMDANGNREYDYGQYQPRPITMNRNVVWERELDLNETTKNTLEGMAFADITFLKDFNFSVKASLYNADAESRGYYNKEVGSGVNTSGLATRSITRDKSYIFQQQLTWNKIFKDVHNVEVFLGHENYHYMTKYLYAEKQEETFAGKPDLINFATMNDLTDYEDNYKTEGYIGRLKYSYDNKYFVEGSIRRDGSSRFHKDHRWGNFWSLGGSWMISREKFMKDIKWIDDLKLRASYGEVGNDGSVGLYGHMALYNLTINGGLPASYKEQNEATDIVWESTNSFGVAVEGRFFDRFNVSLEYYDKRSHDLLFDVSLPLSAGSFDGYNPTLTKNLGSVSNRGWELDVNIDLLKKKDLLWTFNFNASTINNKIVTLPEEYREAGILSGNKKLVEGGGIYDYWLYQSVGVDQMTGRTLYIIDTEKYAVEKTEGKTTISSQYLAKVNGVDYTTRPAYAKKDWEGTSLPDVFGSFGTSVSWKNLTFSALCTYSLGAKVYDGTYHSLMENLTADVKSLHKNLLNAWDGVPAGMTETSPNRIDPNGIPALDGYHSSDNNAMSDRWLMDGSYLMVKNVSVNYKFPQNICNKLDISGLNLTLGVENLISTYNLKGSNPQASFNGSVSSSFNAARTFSVGLNVTL